MEQNQMFYVMRFDTSNDNYYTYWRLRCTEAQIKELVTNRERELGTSRVSLRETTEEDVALGETHRVDENGVLWTKTYIQINN